MNPTGHEMILASAGSGKTYALTNRYVALLAHGAAPERIAALTFTRKAAGEFSDEILHKLAAAADDGRTAEELGRSIGRPGYGRAGFARLLRQTVAALPRLRLGTLDGFFARIARAFPYELGLAGGFDVLEEHTARLERQRVLQRMFVRIGELDTAQRDFLEAFKRATFGGEEKRLGPKLEAFLDAHHERWLEAPDQACWGAPERIWPDGGRWLGAPVDPAAARTALQAWVDSAVPEGRQRERWRAFLAAVETWAPGMTPATELVYVLAKAAAVWPALSAGRARLEFDRKPQELAGAAAAALAELVRYVFGGELQRRLTVTRGLYAVLRGYDTVYHEAVRRAGRLTFGDVQRLLQPGPGGGGVAQLDIAYRLDGRIDHWLLDEFQDTSRGQWSILEELVGEALQDGSGERSFFCVGDVKQAIFTWRDGDPRLLREILRRYNGGGEERIAQRHLVESWRSGPPAISLVNTVFSAAGALAQLFPAAGAAWNAEWQPHRSAVPQRGGQAAVLLADDEDGRWRTLLDILREIRPLERGLTCAVLVPKNETAVRLADYLRREGGWPAVAESDQHVCTDQPLGAALLALFQVAAHPGDRLAWEHLGMTPLGAVLAAEGLDEPGAAALRLLGEVHTDGFERTCERWLARLEPAFAPDDRFSRTRARQLAAAAARFDRTGSREIDEFLAFMERHTVREAESAAVVKVMTIHKSKGLGFDLVVLPDLQGNRIDERREGLAVRKTADRRVDWVLDLPTKLFCEADPALAAYVKEADAEAGYEALALLYVALTRAKRGCYAIIEPVGKSTSRNYPRVLAETLGDNPMSVTIGGGSFSGIWADGDPAWAENSRPGVPAASAAPELIPLETGSAGAPLRPAARRASEDAGSGATVASVFALEGAARRDFGASVHRCLAQVEWFDAAAGPLPAAWRAETADANAAREAEACLRAPELAGVWRRPAGAAEVWRERAFEMMVEGAWISGAFDRVVVRRDAAGAAVAATVYDFKTDRVSGEEAVGAALRRHRPQLALYRTAVARLTGLPEARVAAEIVFTGLRGRGPIAVGGPPEA